MIRGLKIAAASVVAVALAGAVAAAAVYVWAAAQVGMTLLYVLGGGA